MAGSIRKAGEPSAPPKTLTKNYIPTSFRLNFFYGPP